MAKEEIKLVGTFQDDITPKLQKMNRSLTTIGKSFKTFSHRLKPITTSFNKMADASLRFNKAMGVQAKAITESTRAMRGYRQNANKMAGAMRKVTDARVKAQRQMGMSRAQIRKNGGGGVAPVAGATSGKSYGVSAAKGFNAGVGSIAIGTAIGGMASQMFMRGLSSLKNMALSPFKKFGSAFMERVGDEMDDLKSAGGMFALDLDLTKDNGNEKLFRDFNAALQFQEKINSDMAKSASNLPGTTSQFVATNRQLTDTIQMTMEKDRDKFMKFAESQGADVSMGGIEGAKNAMAKVGQNLTESVMLASSGQVGGLPMHIAIQQILAKEKGDFKAQTFTNKFRAAFQKNPLLKNFLMRAEEEINKYDAGTAEKLEAIMDVFARATPEEQISKMRGSLSGLIESVRSGILDPQGGLFGLSRAVSDFDESGNLVGELKKKDVDIRGNTLYKIAQDLKGADGKALQLGEEKIVKGAQLTAEQLTKLGLTFDKVSGVVKQGNKEVGEFSTSSTYLFEQLRNSLANYGAVFTQIVGFLPTIFDPFAKMTKMLMPITEKSQEMFRVFRVVDKALNADVDEMRKSADNVVKGSGANLRKQVLARSALFSMADFLQGTGLMGDDEAKELKEKLVGSSSKTKEAIDNFDKTGAAVFKQMFERLLNSDIINNIGEMAGTLIGGIMDTTFEIINGLMGNFVKAGPGQRLMEGFSKGFDNIFKDRGGFEGFMGRVNDLLAQIISEIGTLIVTKVIPGMISNLIQFILGSFNAGPGGVLIGGGVLAGLVTVVGATTTAMWSLVAGANKAAFKLMTLGGGGVGRTKGRAAAQLAKPGKFLNKMKDFFLGDVTGAKGLVGATKAGVKGGPLAGLAEVAKSLKGGFKAGAKLGALGGIITAATKVMEGQSILDALSAGLASAGGSAIGAAIGTVLLGPFGTVLGAWIGGMMADTEAVVAPVKSAIISIIGSVNEVGAVFEELFGFATDIVAAVFTLIPGLDKAAEGFSFLGAVVFALLSPFKLLELGLIGLKVMLMELRKFAAKFGVGSFDESDQAQLNKAKGGLESKTDKFTIEGRQAAGFSLQQQKDAEYAKWKAAQTDEEKNRHVRYMRVIEQKIKDEEGRLKKNTDSPFKKDLVGQTTPVGQSIPAESVAVGDPYGLKALRAGNVSGMTAEQRAQGNQGTVFTPEDTGVAAVTANTEAIIEPTKAMNTSLTEMKTPIMELPMKMDESTMRQTMELGTIIGEYLNQLSNKMDEVVAAMTRDTEFIKIDSTQFPLPVRMDGLAGLMGAKAAPNYKGNVYSAAGGMNLGSAIATEMKHKPAGSDLVIANSSETIIPAGMSASAGGGSMSVGDITVNVSGVDDPKAIANQVAEEILDAVQRATYSEIFTS